MAKQNMILHVALILMGIGLYYLLIIGNMRSNLSIFLGEVGSLAICYGGIALLKSIKDKK